jgi:hypothetical protein
LVPNGSSACGIRLRRDFDLVAIIADDNVRDWRIARKRV